LRFASFSAAFPSKQFKKIRNFPTLTEWLLIVGKANRKLHTYLSAKNSSLIQNIVKPRFQSANNILFYADLVHSSHQLYLAGYHQAV
jgi:hypothetical protein